MLDLKVNMDLFFLFSDSTKFCFVISSLNTNIIIINTFIKTKLWNTWQNKDWNKQLPNKTMFFNTIWTTNSYIFFVTFYYKNYTGVDGGSQLLSYSLHTLDPQLVPPSNIRCMFLVQNGKNVEQFSDQLSCHFRRF